jgi:hypothetical protein
LPPILRSIVAIMAGFIIMNVVLIILSLPASLFHVYSGNPTLGFTLFNIFQRLLAAISAGSAAALVAGRKPIEHGGALAILLLAFGINALRHFTGEQPQWYPWLLVIATPLCAVAGAALVARSVSAGSLPRG